MKTERAKAESLSILDEIRLRKPLAIFPRASTQAIARVEQRLKQCFTKMHREFLEFCNGADVGQGGIYGIETKESFYDLERRCASYPQFKDWEVLPVAGDGCGNFYLLDTHDGDVYFYDAMSDDKLGYAVASDFWHFVYFYLVETELKIKHGWPDEKTYVLEVDPKLARPCKAPPIWET